MKAKLFIYLSVLFCGLVFYSCGTNDVKIKNSVEAEIQKEYPGITASSLNGTVTLTGTVDSEEAKTKIGEIAKGVRSVGSVTNKIFVNTPEPVVVETPDETFAKVVFGALNTAGFTNVTATIKDSVVTLTGDVPKADLKKVLETVNNLKPKKVENQLTTK